MQSVDIIDDRKAARSLLISTLSNRPTVSAVGLLDCFTELFDHGSQIIMMRSLITGQPLMYLDCSGGAGKWFEFVDDGLKCIYSEL
jgi:hypothetical protein